MNTCTTVVAYATRKWGGPTVYAVVRTLCAFRGMLSMSLGTQVGSYCYGIISSCEFIIGNFRVYKMKMVRSISATEILLKPAWKGLMSLNARFTQPSIENALTEFHLLQGLASVFADSYRNYVARSRFGRIPAIWYEMKRYMKGSIKINVRETLSRKWGVLTSLNNLTFISQAHNACAVK